MNPLATSINMSKVAMRRLHHLDRLLPILPMAQRTARLSFGILSVFGLCSATGPLPLLKICHSSKFFVCYMQSRCAICYYSVLRCKRDISSMEGEYRENPSGASTSTAEYHFFLSHVFHSHSQENYILVLTVGCCQTSFHS
jgi:hypothetical protein